MPELEADDTGGVVIAGAYAHLIEVELRYRGPDPRVYVGPDDVVTRVAAATTVSPLQRKLDAGEPVVVPGWRLGGGRGLRLEFPHLTGRASVRVYPDDRVELSADESDAV